MLKKFMTICISMGLMFCQADALIFGIECDSSANCDIYYFFDAHPDAGCTEPKVEGLQRHQIVAWAKNLGAVVLAEDMTAYAGKNAELKAAIHEGNKDAMYFDTTISFLLPACRKMGVEVYNVEFRHDKTPSILGLHNVTARNLMENVRCVVHELYRYAHQDEPQFLKDYYKQTYERYIKSNWFVATELLEFDADKTAGEFLDNIKQWKPEDALNEDEQKDMFKELPQHIFKSNTQVTDALAEQIHLSDLEFIDAKLVHHIYDLGVKKGRKTIFVCVGSGHINNIRPEVVKMGFRPVPTSKVRKDIQLDFGENHIKINASSAVDIHAYFESRKKESNVFGAKKASEKEQDEEKDKAKADKQPEKKQKVSDSTVSGDAASIYLGKKRADDAAVEKALFERIFGKMPSNNEKSAGSGIVPSAQPVPAAAAASTSLPKKQEEKKRKRDGI